MADAVRALRSELTAAMSEGEGQRLRFELDGVEMEFLLEVRKEGSGEAGIKFWVINVGGRAGVSSGLHASGEAGADAEGRGDWAPA